MAEAQHGDDDYALLGRYVAEFSAMVAAMRHAMVFRLQQPSIPPLAVWAVFAGAGARQISDSFFTMARLVVEHDAAESHVSAALQARIEREISRRNAFAHGDWHIGWSATTGADDPADSVTTPLPTTIFRVLGGDPVFHHSTPDLRDRCNAVIRSTAMVRAYATATVIGALPDLRVSDVMRVEDNEIVPGPNSGGWEDRAKSREV